MTDSSQQTWEEINERMNRASKLLEFNFDGAGARQAHILKQRAEVLAQKEKKEERREFVEVVQFRLADELYAVECLYVREVYHLKELTPLPGTPPFVLGIVSVRGEIVSVVDLKRFFQMPQKGLNDLTRVIILRQKDTGMEFGILAEEVLGTISLSVRGIQSPQDTLPTLTGVRAEYLKGVTSGHLIVLDAAKLLADEKIVVNQEVEV